MRRFLPHLLATALLVLAAGCVTANATMLVPAGQHAPVPADEVRIFLKGDTVPSSCQRVALVFVSGNADMSNRSELIAAGRRRAGQVGANAISLDDIREPSTLARIAGDVIPGVGTPPRKTQMVAYRCPDDAAAPAPAPPAPAPPATPAP